MDIYINNKVHEFQNEVKLTDALDALNLSSARGIAVAINNNVIPKQDWTSYTLQPNDKVTLIRATQGG